jgi:anhydro-N-acetylmuramic acid kinase
VRHRPQQFDGTGYTIQLAQPALLAELAGIRVVADFRSRDVAAGGQGAPLVPGFHRLIFGGARPRAVVNIGGISNVTALVGNPVIGFDAGPGNALIDGWMAAHFGAPYDDGGALAASASPDERLVDEWMRDSFFAASPPKSTGRDLFTLDWACRNPRVGDLEPAVVLASLTDLTARSIAEALLRWVPEAEEVLVCGGGARNATLLGSLARKLGDTRLVKTTDALGVPSDQVEALAFAWLARRHIRREPGNVPSVTGARGDRILGALYPGRPSGAG